MSPVVSSLIGALVWLGEWTEFLIARSACLMFGHVWSDWSGDPRVMEMRVCERVACRGRSGSVDLR
jgi:hypothetical protein